MNNQVIIKYLESQGYSVDTSYYNHINNWIKWYQGIVEDFHNYHDQEGKERTIARLGMGKRGCEDWSSILFTERDSLVCDKEANQEFLNKELERLHFEDMVSDNIELAFACGTVGTITRVKNVLVKNNELLADQKSSFDLINVSADQIIPLRIEHGNIIDVAFISQISKDNKLIYYIEIHELKDDGYHIRNIYLDKDGKEAELKDDILSNFCTHSDIPLFNLLMPKIVNNDKSNNGLGLSINANAIDELKFCDLTFNNFNQDIYLGGKKVFYNKSLVKYQTVTKKDSDGNIIREDIPIYPDDLTRQQFKILDGDMSSGNDKEFIHEYNPDLRVEENEKAMNYALNLYSFKIGLGKGYYRFENGTVVTATQYLGENKDLVGNAKKHRKRLNSYTVGIARSILLLGKLLWGEKLDENDIITLTDKDGFLISDEELQEQYRQDYNAGLMSKVTYLQKARGMSEELALKEIELAKKDNPQLKDLVGD